MERQQLGALEGNEEVRFCPQMLKSVEEHVVLFCAKVNELEVAKANLAVQMNGQLL